MATETTWIEHDGGPCPVDLDARIYVRFEDGTTDECVDPVRASYWVDETPETCSWRYRDGKAGIIAYRVVSA